MSKPGEMIQLLRENYEEQLEAYRLLRNKFLIAVPGMNLDKEKALYERWKSDLHLNSIIDASLSAPEERSCTTCRQHDPEYDHCLDPSGESGAPAATCPAYESKS